MRPPAGDRLHPLAPPLPPDWHPADSRDLGAGAIGLVLGALGSVFASRVLEGLLFGVTPNDPLTLGLVALLMGLVGVVATLAPAVRASSVQPVEALRSE